MIKDPRGFNTGRPLKFENVQELEQKIDDFFQSLYEVHRDMWGNPIKDKMYKKQPGDEDNPNAGYVMKKARVATVTGLAVALDTGRDTLMNYEHGKYDDRDGEGNEIELTEVEKKYNEQVDTFSNTIKRAKQMILQDTEQQLFMPGRSTGAIFSLKVNYEWQDKTVVENIDDTTNPFADLTPDQLRAIAKAKENK